ncbi:cupin domain-containing protein [Rosenbergiella nectarea]|uniref:cupin domain-containing protein n=1 Tax=Rosenbergiella nectarea TaxID=988801 RepID=UPI001F4EE1A5|nr:cupin domain-containing protein [Rosenbergiella nectarea]
MIDKATAEHYQWGDQCDGWYLLKRQDLLIIHEQMPANTAERRHYHEQSRQFFFVLSGELVMELAGEMHRVQAQQGLEIPPNVPHQARNASPQAVEFLVISHPSTRGDRHDLPVST